MYLIGLQLVTAKRVKNKTRPLIKDISRQQMKNFFNDLHYLYLHS